MKAYKLVQKLYDPEGNPLDGVYSSYVKLPQNVRMEYRPDVWVTPKIGKLFVFREYHRLLNFLSREHCFVQPESGLCRLPATLNVWEVETQGAQSIRRDILQVCFSTEEDFIKTWGQDSSLWGLTPWNSRKAPEGTYLCDAVKLVKELKMVT